MVREVPLNPLKHRPSSLKMIKLVSLSQLQIIKTNQKRLWHQLMHLHKTRGMHFRSQKLAKQVIKNQLAHESKMLKNHKLTSYKGLFPAKLI